MASNPYEQRWEVYNRAEDLLRNRYEAESYAWREKKEAGIDPGDFPEFPTDDAIYQTAQRMKDWYEAK
tara:strand:- start:244 stop:447 length:204 start_codon:yes stop_codon:yes gene_type:complete